MRRKNLILADVYLIFEIKHFEHTYGYSIQWGIFEQEINMFLKSVTLHFLTKHIFKNMSQCTPYSGTLRHHLG